MSLSRRAFLRGAAVLAGAAAVGSCRPPAPAAPPSPAPPARVPRDWDALAKMLDVRIIRPSDRDFAAAKAVFNSRFDGFTPAVVVTPKFTEDVARAVTVAAQNGLQVAARSGGHSYIGDSTATDTIVVDLRSLGDEMIYDGATQLTTISAGAQLDSVHRALDAHDRSIPTGSCPTVGISGLTLGGGLGADARLWGLTCDALESATVVLPNGDTVVASADEYDDLLWGLRGGGGGHFGVVTSFTFHTFATTDRDVVTLEFPERVAAQMIRGWQEWINAADRSVWSMVNITASSTGLRCSVVVATPAGGGPEAAADLAGAVGTSAVDTTIRTLNHLAFVDYFSGGDDARRPRGVVAGSDIVGEMSSAAAESIVAAISARPDEVASATVVIESLSGAVRDVDPAGSAFPWRRQDASLQWYTEPQPGNADAAEGWLADAHRILGSHSVGGYVNYVEASTPAARYFGDNLDRLTAVQRRYDPVSVMYSGVRY